MQLQQVILNLLINAMEAMNGVSEGLRQLEVGSEKVTRICGELEEDSINNQDRTQIRTSGRSSRQETQVLVVVRDSGPGFDPNSLNRLFNAFYRTKPQGLGIGLAISRSIIEAHGGRLWATANVPNGAVFRFMLPTPIRVESESH